MKLIIILVLVIIIIIIFKKNYNEPFTNKKYKIWMWYSDTNKNPSGGLGNILSVFFNSMIFNYHIKKNLNFENEIDNNFEYRRHFMNLFNSFKNQKFTQKQLNLFPKDIAYDAIWNINKHNTKIYWDNIKVQVNASLKTFTKNIEIQELENYPILHFRCSDVPFVKHNYYHFSKYKFYKWCDNKLKNGILCGIIVITLIKTIKNGV
jgi:hypothetical protein